MTPSNEPRSVGSPPKTPTTRLTAPADFAAARSVKRQLLQEQRTGWETGLQVPLEDLIARWPGDPEADPDAASLLFEDYFQKRRLGTEAPPEAVAQHLPAQRSVLTHLSYQQDLLRSLGGEKCARALLLELPSAGDEVFGFQLRQELGRGSFARVFLAEQKSLADRPVVVKVSAIDGDEPQTLAQLQHTNIMPIYSAHDDPAAGLRVVCMPYFGGASLSRVLQALWAQDACPKRGAQLVAAFHLVSGPPVHPPRQQNNGLVAEQTPDAGLVAQLAGQSYVRAVASLVARLAEALQHAHERGILHRDIKPSNILLAADGQPLLLDFNLSQNRAGGQAQASAALGGTVAYMAPEHLRALASRDPVLARQIDCRADIYELGMVLYEMLTGRRPFDQSASYSPMPALIEAMALERGRAVPSLRAQRPDVSWTLESVCRKCLAPDPAQRYQRAEHVALDLRRYLEDHPLKYAPELNRAERVRKFIRRHPRLTQASAAIAAAMLLLGAGAGVLFATQAKLRSAHARVYEAEGAEARERQQSFTTGAERARCLVNTTTGDPDQVTEGLQVCAQILSLYNVLDRDNWQQHPAWQRLDQDEQRTLAEDIREVLFLLASGNVYLATAQAGAEAPRDAAIVAAPGMPALRPLNVLASISVNRAVRGGKPDAHEWSQAALKHALALLERAERVPGLAASSALWHDRATYLQQLDDAAGAAAARARAAGFSPTSTADHYLLAAAYARKRQTREAVAELNQALRLNPRHYWSLFLLGTIQEDQGEHTLAYGSFSGCIHLWPEFAYGYYNRAGVLRRLGKNQQALDDYNAALARDPKLGEAHLNRGLTYLAEQRWSEALADFDRAAVLGRDQARVHWLRGIALEGLRRAAEADAAFTRAWALDGENSELLLGYGFAVTNRLPAQAEEAFNKVLRREPRNARALYGYAMLAQRKSRTSQTALLYFNLALQADPNLVPARAARANVLVHRGECELARQDIDWCIKQDPSGVTLYAAACVYALIADRLSGAVADAFADRALQLLQEALARGYGKDRAAADSDLEHLHHRPDFRRLLRPTPEAPSEHRGG